MRAVLVTRNMLFGSRRVSETFNILIFSKIDEMCEKILTVVPPSCPAITPASVLLVEQGTKLLLYESFLPQSGNRRCGTCARVLLSVRMSFMVFSRLGYRLPIGCLSLGCRVACARPAPGRSLDGQYGGFPYKPRMNAAGLPRAP